MVAATSETVSLGAYWEILRKRRATILAATVITTGLVALVVFRMRPIYQATARMEVQAETPQLQTLNNLNQPSATDDAFLQTQVDLLQNNNLAWETDNDFLVTADARFHGGSSSRHSSSQGPPESQSTPQ
jgi:uncharacterized protein involved in exopolysaccharide biosynthesis